MSNKETINSVAQIPVHRWNFKQVKIWLTENRLTAFIDVFEENNVDGKYLLDLTDRVLEDEFLIESYDDRLKILLAKNGLQKVYLVLMKRLRNIYYIRKNIQIINII